MEILIVIAYFGTIWTVGAGLAYATRNKIDVILEGMEL